MINKIIIRQNYLKELMNQLEIREVHYRHIGVVLNSMVKLNTFKIFRNSIIYKKFYFFREIAVL